MSNKKAVVVNGLEGMNDEKVMRKKAVFFDVLERMNVEKVMGKMAVFVDGLEGKNVMGRTTVFVDGLEGMNDKKVIEELLPPDIYYILDMNDDKVMEELELLPAVIYIMRMKARRNADLYIDSALRSSRTNEVFIFCHDKYVVITYDPTSTSTSPGKGSQVVKGPLLVSDGFPSLYMFVQYGVDAAFGCHVANNEAYLFGGPMCIKIEYGPDIRMGNAFEIPLFTWAVFPCLLSIGFVGHIDAAFESTVVDEAYLFKGSKYAILNYARKTVVRTGLITDEFPCLLNTKFARRIRATFASHLLHQAYLFKDDNSYVVIHYNPGKPNDSRIVSGPAEMVPSNWPSLQGIVSFKKQGPVTTEPKTWTPQWRGVGWDGEPTDSLSSRAYIHDYDTGVYENELVPPPLIRI